jgi:hypothetical protein
MRNTLMVFLILLISGLWMDRAEARIAAGGGGGGMRTQVGNRSVSVDRSNVNQSVNRDVSNRNINRNVDRSSVDVNRNVNPNVNRDIDVNRDIGVHRGVWVDDHDWGWGSFAAGAAIGATSAAVGAAIADDNDPVVEAPPLAVGSIVSTLPPSCPMIVTSATTVYSCNGVYYQPYYQGASLVYQVVAQP